MADEEEERSDAFGFVVVGIGASAGGITALQSLLKAIPAKPGFALVVVQHLLPDRASHLAKILSAWAAFPVSEAGDGVRLEAGRGYVAPPGVALGLRGGVFTTERLDGAGPDARIDIIDSFFEGLAAACGPRAVAVVLSGTGSDGAAGTVRVKQAGGVVLVQEPATAMHDSMPRAAIKRGAADHVLPLGALAQELVACATPDLSLARTAAPPPEDLAAELNGIIEVMRTKAGFDLSGYTRKPLIWRIQQRMDRQGVTFFRDYKSLLQDDPAELDALVRAVPIHVTKFFRDPPAWEELRKRVLPRLFAEAGDRPIRAWTPACATGEEAFSLAMLLAERAEAAEKPLDFQVFATDVSPHVVARASRGTFDGSSCDTLSPERRRRFFRAANGGFRIRRELRGKMVFALQDLLADPPLSGLDLVTCRNLLIYLDRAAADRVIYLLHSSLRPGGYLFLGRAEPLPPAQRGFEALAPGVHLYRKTAPAPDGGFVFPKQPSRLRNAGSGESAADVHAHTMSAEMHDVPAALVGDNFELCRVYGDASPFLRLRAGEPTLILPDLLAPKLAAAFRTAAQEARDRQGAATSDWLDDPLTGRPTLQIRVSPLDPAPDGSAPLLVSFLSSAETRASAKAKPLSRTGAGPGFEAEWTEALRLSRQELEASREELQVLNEELRAANDQLNIANDELAAANARLSGKIEELEMQSNVLSAGAVMTLFLDETLHVRWFTPAISALFPLIPTDIGRLITDLVPRFDDPTFLGDVLAVMQGKAPREAEVRNSEDTWFLRRVGCYVAEAGARMGAAVTFTEISERKRAEEVLRASEARFRALVTTGAFMLYRMSPDWRQMYQLSGRDVLADTPEPVENWADAYLLPEDRPEIDAAIEEAIRTRSLFELEHRVRLADGGVGWVVSRAVPMFGPDGDIIEWFGAASDVTGRRPVQEALRKR